MLLHPLGSLPTFLIIGAQKAGTSSLYYTLCHHPEILPAATKEVHYFDLNYHQGGWWYRSHFPSLLHRRRQQSQTGRFAIGEATPSYLYHPAAAQRVARLLPQAKLIVLLRDPVARAFSQYQREVRLGREPLSFAEAIATEGDRLEVPDASSFAHRHFSYTARGMYAEQLERWLALFPREQLLVLKSEEFLRDPLRAIQLAVEFLGLSPWTPPEVEQRNVRSYSAMAESDRATLVDLFRESDGRVRELVGIDWERGTPASVHPVP